MKEDEKRNLEENQYDTDMFKDFTLPTEVVRSKVLHIFETFAYTKKLIQAHFHAQEVLIAVKHAWKGVDCPETAGEIHAYLIDATISRPHDYKYHKEYGFRFVTERDH